MRRVNERKTSKTQTEGDARRVLISFFPGGHKNTFFFNRRDSAFLLITMLLFSFDQSWCFFTKETQLLRL